jgi:hypothetical protein
MLNADHARKKLILDVLEVMAMASMAGDKLKADLVIAMFKEAMNASNQEKIHKVDLIKKAIDAMVNIEKEQIKAGSVAEKAKETGGKDVRE